MATQVRPRKITEMTPDELEEALEAASCTDEEMDRAYPHIHAMRAAAAAAVRELQQKGILDENGQLIWPKELPEDMRPDSNTEC